MFMQEKQDHAQIERKLKQLEDKLEQKDEDLRKAQKVHAHCFLFLFHAHSSSLCMLAHLHTAQNFLHVTSISPT